MVKKILPTGSARKAIAAPEHLPLPGAIRESAQQIWLAGLGAFSKAQEEGGKVFEALVKEGLSIQRKTQTAAEERISEASNRVSHLATDISSRAAGQWDKLETIFEDRVAKSLDKLGVPSADKIQALIERIDALDQQVQHLSASAAATTHRNARPAARKTTAPTPKPGLSATQSPAKSAVRKTAPKLKTD